MYVERVVIYVERLIYAERVIHVERVNIYVERILNLCGTWKKLCLVVL